MAGPRQFGLVIFDCDGVLVDSEMLSAGVLMAMMEEEGLPITAEIFRSDFLGRSFASASARAALRFGRPLPDGFEQSYRQRLLARMEEQLQPMDGVAQVLSSLRAPFCLATGSSPIRLSVSLRTTGLAGYFAGCTFDVSQVASGKPAPGLFLLAASRMGFAPRDCLVIEDSEMGVRAGLCAGMAVWHFAGGAHVKAGYRLPEDVVPQAAVASMAALLGAFRQIGLC